VNSVPEPAPGNARSYDVLVRGSDQGFSFHSNRGVTLDDERISWDSDGRPNAARLASVAEVHVQTGGAWGNAVALCQIRFLDGYVLTLVDSYAFGGNADTQKALYRACVHDLHRRLAAAKTAASIRFTAGYTGARYRLVLACGVLLAAMFIGMPLAVFVITREARLLLLMGGSAIFLWPLYLMVRNNAPRTYEPSRIPEDLVPPAG
jgi:hypothetical protein